MQVLGAGGDSCGKFLFERRARSAAMAVMYGAWVTGYLTAYNNHVRSDGDVTKEVDYDGFMAWLDNYCQRHPLDTLYRATNALVHELNERGQK